MFLRGITIQKIDILLLVFFTHQKSTPKRMKSQFKVLARLISKDIRVCTMDELHDLFSNDNGDINIFSGDLDCTEEEDNVLELITEATALMKRLMETLMRRESPSSIINHVANSFVVDAVVSLSLADTALRGMSLKRHLFEDAEVVVATPPRKRGRPRKSALSSP